MEGPYFRMAPIASAEITLVEVNMNGYKLSYGTIDKSRVVLLKLIDTEGTIGWGEADPMQPFTLESASDVVDVLRDELLPAVLRESTPEPERIDSVLDALRDGHYLAKGAISMALLDIKGKKLDIPVAKLLGKIIHRSLPVLWPLSNGSAEADIAIIDTKIVEGYNSFMLKMGLVPVHEEITRVSILKRRYGESIKLIADANQGWSLEEAQRFLDGTKGMRLAFIEQPVVKADIQAMSELTKTGSILISADESLTGLAEAEEIARREAANIFSIKSSKNGGPLRAKAIVEMAQEYGISCYMNSMLELGITQAASLQLAVTVPNLVDAGHAYMSTVRLTGDPTNFSSYIHDGMVDLPEKPGLGVEIDEGKIRQIAISSCRVQASHVLANGC